jgi:hypothetical protein
MGDIYEVIPVIVSGRITYVAIHLAIGSSIDRNIARGDGMDL